MKQEIKNRYTQEVIYTADTETLKEAVEKAVKEKVSLSNADLSNADLAYANLYNVNLSNADLHNANLTGANLRNADLRNADLTEGMTIVSLDGIGSARRKTTYWVEQDKIWCGCFTGTLAEFEAQVKETHGDNVFGKQYRKAITYLKGIKSLEGGKRKSVVKKKSKHTKKQL